MNGPIIVKCIYSKEIDIFITPFRPMKSVIRPLVIAPSIAPIVTKEPNMENCHKTLLLVCPSKKYSIKLNVNEEGTLEY